MKLVTFRTAAGGQHIGAVVQEREIISDFTASAPNAPWAQDMLALIDGGDSALAAARELAERPRVAVPLHGATLLAPVPEPRQIRDFLTFERHFRQSYAARHYLGIEGFPRDPEKVTLPAVWYKQPIYYKCNRFSVVGPEQDVKWPRYSKVMDYELEVGIFLGRSGKNISRHEARNYIFGYCIFNDFSARDAQVAEMAGGLGPAKGKDFDTGYAMGPWLVTADEVEDYRALKATARINGEVWSDSSTAEMGFGFEDIIEYASTDEQVRAGEFMAGGTIPNGSGQENGRFLKEGDVIELEVSGLGLLRNKITREGS